MAYALGCVASEPGLGLAPDRRRLRAGVAVGLRFLIRLGELAEHLVALVVQPLQAARLALGKRVGGENREADRVVQVTDHGVRELLRVDLPPAHRLGRRRPREAAGVGAGVGHMEIVVVSLLTDLTIILYMRLCLKYDV